MVKWMGKESEEEDEDLEDLDEEQLVKIFQSQGILKKSKKEIEEERKKMRERITYYSV